MEILNHIQVSCILNVKYVYELKWVIFYANYMLNKHFKA
jgi:hypothetical protein